MDALTVRNADGKSSLLFLPFQVINKIKKILSSNLLTPPIDLLLTRNGTYYDITVKMSKWLKE